MPLFVHMVVSLFPIGAVTLTHSSPGQQIYLFKAQETIFMPGSCKAKFRIPVRSNSGYRIVLGRESDSESPDRGYHDVIVRLRQFSRSDYVVQSTMYWVLPEAVLMSVLM